jgi:hypothetical protein
MRSFCSPLLPGFGSWNLYGSPHFLSYSSILAFLLLSELSLP